MVTIRWDRPKTDGGSPISGYLVEHRRTGSPHWVRAHPSLVSSAELALSGLEPGWRYQFRITAENIVGPSGPSELSDPLTVTLQRNAISPPRFTIELSDTVVIENDKVEFQVTVIGTPTPEINWFKDGFEIFSSRRTKILTENNTSVLIIHETALTDEGEIKCTATNRAGHAATKSMLKVDAPPKIRLPRQYEDGMLVEAEEPIRLKVGIAGRPPPSIIWSHNGENISNGDHFEIETTEKNSGLKVVHASRQDRGEYNVRAVNKLGEDNASVLVTVTARPCPPSKVTVSMSLGKTVNLSWNAPDDDGGCKIGNYIVEYFRIGWNVWLKASTTRQLSTTLADLIEGSEYKFRVKAENPYGMSDPSDESNVLFIPDPKRGILKPDTETANRIFDDDQKPVAPRRRRMSPMSSSNHSLEDAIVKTADKGEQTHMARLKIQKSTVNVQLIPQILDTEAIARDMSYGSPDPVMKENVRPKDTSIRDRSPVPGRDLVVSSSTKTVTVLEMAPPLRSLSPHHGLMPSSRSPVRSLPVPQKESTPPDHQASVATYTDTLTYTTKETVNNLQPPDRQKSSLLERSPRDKHDAVHSSGEFMLVLYDEEKEQKSYSSKLCWCFLILNIYFGFVCFSEEQKSFDFEMEDTLPPPPLSLSAPELSAVPLAIPTLKRSVSSTELLYERAMARFYKAMEYEESTQTKKLQAQKLKEELLKPISRRESVGSMERGLERKSSLRRRLSGEIPQISLKLPDFSGFDEKFEENSTKPKYLYPQESLDDPDYMSPAQDEYTDDYTDSTASSDESETEKFKRMVREHGQSFSDKELDTYHPQSPEIRVGSPYSPPSPDQAVEVLTKPYSLPSPDFVPKPILKRPPSVESDSGKEEKKKPKKHKSGKGFSKIFDRKQSNGDVVKDEGVKVSNNNSIDESAAKLVAKEEVSSNAKPPQPVQVSASNQAKLKKLEMRQSSMEEEKVVIDHYSDIVKEKGSGRKAGIPLYLNPEELKKAAESDEEQQEIEVRQTKQEPVIETPLLAPSTRKIINSTLPQSRPASRNSSLVRSPEEGTRRGSVEEKGMESFDNTSRGRTKTTRDKQSAQPRSRDPSAASTNRAPSRNSSAVRRTSKTPVEARVASKTRNRSESKSPVTANRRPLSASRERPVVIKPTQLSSEAISSVTRPVTPEQQQHEIDSKVKSTMSYTTDLVLFLVACWVYLFKDARLALPILILLIYRQISDYIPSWMRNFPRSS